ncbi:MAG: hypothetical protein J7K90_03530, partial [Desulfuromusa sp.]|nr:hypothetical protein [Desulfuromusa sp.]
MKKMVWLFLVLFTLSFASAAGAKDIKAAFVYVGPVGDGGWTYAHDQGRIEMATLPFVKKTTFIESVPEGADATRVIMGLANKGYNLIFT